MMLRTLTICLLLLTGCGNNNSTSLPPSSMQTISGRGTTQLKPEIYRARVPDHWVRRDPFPSADLSDTTLSVVDFFIVDETGTVRIAVHNFPSEKLEQRIPPKAQVMRWQRQFESLDPLNTVVEPIAFSGYAGLKFKGIGTAAGDDLGVIAWSLQLGESHYLALMSSPQAERRSDVTIKATGPSSLINKYEDDITAFAESFEQIEEIPQR